MPIYKNNTTSPITVIDSNGQERTLRQGDQTATIKYYNTTETGLTKISDTPYINPVAGYNIVSLASSATSTITLADTKISRIRVQKATGTDAAFDIFFQTASNTPAVFQKYSVGDAPIDIIVKEKCDSIVIVNSGSGAGTLQVIQRYDYYNTSLIY